MQKGLDNLKETDWSVGEGACLHAMIAYVHVLKANSETSRDPILQELKALVPTKVKTTRKPKKKEAAASNKAKDPTSDDAEDSDDAKGLACAEPVINMTIKNDLLEALKLEFPDACDKVRERQATLLARSEPPTAAELAEAGLDVNDALAHAIVIDDDSGDDFQMDATGNSHFPYPEIPTTSTQIYPQHLISTRPNKKMN